MADNDCIFCKIINREIPSDIQYEDDDILVFPDINPATPVHLLIVTRKHIPSLGQMADADTPLVGKMVKAANRLAREQGLSEKGAPGTGRNLPRYRSRLPERY